MRVRTWQVVVLFGCLLACGVVERPEDHRDLAALSLQQRQELVTRSRVVERDARGEWQLYEVRRMVDNGELRTVALVQRTR